MTSVFTNFGVHKGFLVIWASAAIISQKLARFFRQKLENRFLWSDFDVGGFIEISEKNFCACYVNDPEFMLLF